MTWDDGEQPSMATVATPDDGRRANLNRSEVESLYHILFQRRRIKTRAHLNSSVIEVTKHVSIHDYTEREHTLYKFTHV